MANPEMGDSEAEVPGFLSQRPSCLADVCPWTRREGAVYAHLCFWEKIPTHYTLCPFLADSSRSTVPPFLFLASQVLLGQVQCGGVEGAVAWEGSQT